MSFKAVRLVRLGRVLGFVGSLSIVALLAGPAHAGNSHRPRPSPGSHSAPEIDPAGLGAMASLLVGGTLLLKGRRRDARRP